MLKISLQVWLFANLIVFGLFVLSFFPSGFALGWEALQYSVVFSAPAIAIINVLLRLLKQMGSTVGFSWFLLLTGIGAAAFLSYKLFVYWPLTKEYDLPFVRALAFVSGYAAVLICSPSLHYFFQKIQYGNEND